MRLCAVCQQVTSFVLNLYLRSCVRLEIGALRPTGLLYVKWLTEAGQMQISLWKLSYLIINMGRQEVTLLVCGLVLWSLI